MAQMERGVNFDSKGFDSVFPGFDTDKFLEQRERELWQQLGTKGDKSKPEYIIKRPGTLQLYAFDKNTRHSVIKSHRDESLGKHIKYRRRKSRIEIQMDMLENGIERARANWACITAKSQRVENFKYPGGVHYEVNTYKNLTEIKPKYERSPMTEPPKRAGETIQRFTERSRQRMMSRARKLNTEFMKINKDGKRRRQKKDLPTPYFVTLTYHKNFQDCEAAKKHLNAFFQRWRRRGKDFAYFWKMEPQKRGAVHFHIAMFIPERFNVRKSVNEYRVKAYIEKLKDSGAWRFHDYKSVALMLIVSDDWAEVTKNIDGYDAPYTKFDYIRKKAFKTENLECPERFHRFKKLKKYGRKSVYTRCANPRLQYNIEPDWQHRFYGCNVRKCDNWKMFLGYVYEYMKKKVPDNPWEGRDTGRFWGFSYNLDFEALQTGFVSHEDIDHMNDFCNALNTMTFASLTKHLIKNAKRARATLNGKKLQAKLTRYRNTFEAQKRRYKINRDKIEKGYLMQFEIESEKALQLREFLQEKRFQKVVAEFEKALYNENEALQDA